MERVIFLNERTGERIPCMLNPETVEFRRIAGVRPRSLAGAKLTGAPSAHDPLLATGGGRTEFVLDLLFDVDLMQPVPEVRDVRVSTARLWQAAQSEFEGRRQEEPTVLRFLWGRAWNIPAVVVALSERLDRFDPNGVPTRSWLRVQLVQVDEAAAASAVRPSNSGELVGEPILSAFGSSDAGA